MEFAFFYLMLTRPLNLEREDEISLPTYIRVVDAVNNNQSLDINEFQLISDSFFFFCYFNTETCELSFFFTSRQQQFVNIAIATIHSFSSDKVTEMMLRKSIVAS